MKTDAKQVQGGGSEETEAMHGLLAAEGENIAAALNSPLLEIASADEAVSGVGQVIVGETVEQVSIV